MPPLNDDQFDSRLDALLREEDAQDDELLAMENEDANDLARMREALGNYKAETLRFAEEKSATLPAPRVPRIAALWDSTPRWAVAATAVLAFGFTTVFVTHRNAEPAPVAIAAAPSAQAISEDNQLLLSVDEALNANAAPTEEDLGLSATPAHSMKHGRATN